MGRPRKPTATLKLSGAFRADRHGDRAELSLSGEPAKPRGLDRDAAAWWDSVVPELVMSGVARLIDTSIVEQAARMWSLLRKAQRKAERHPTDPEIRNAVTGYFTAWERAASKLGLTPVDRARIVADARPKRGVATRQRGA